MATRGFTLKNMLAMTLTNTVAKLGFIPDCECGDKIKRIMRAEDDASIIALGCILDDCVKEGSYDSLAKQLKTIPETNTEIPNTTNLGK